MGNSLAAPGPLTFALAVVVVGAVVVPGLSLIRLRRFPGHIWRASSERKLAFWGARRAESDAARWEAALSSDALFTGWWITAAGVTAAFGLALFAWLAVIFEHTSAKEIAPYVWLVTEIFATLFVIGADVAYLVANRRANAVLGSRSTPMTSEPRAVGDYISPVLWAVWTVLVVLMLAIYLRRAQVEPVASITFPGYHHTWPTLTLGVVSFLCAIFLALFVAFSAQLIVNAPGLAGAEDGLEESLNDAHRAQALSITFLLPFELTVYALVSSIPGSVSNPLVITLVFLLLLGPLSAVAGASQGRLGGGLTGWWWQRRPAAREQRAEEGV